MDGDVSRCRETSATASGMMFESRQATNHAGMIHAESKWSGQQCCLLLYVFEGLKEAKYKVPCVAFPLFIPSNCTGIVLLCSVNWTFTFVT